MLADVTVIDTDPSLNTLKRSMQINLKDISDSFKSGLNSVKEAFKISGQFLTKATRASYNLAGQYTFPIEQELLGTEPPTFENLNPIGIGLLSITLVIPFTLLASVTIVPIIGNSIQSFSDASRLMVNLSLPKEYQLPYLDSIRHPLRVFAAGFLGVVAGVSAGLIMAALITMLRATTNSINTAVRVSISSANLVLHEYDQIWRGNLGQNDHRSDWQQLFLGGPGLIIGGLTGIFLVMGISIGRLISNNLKTAYHVIKDLSILVLPKSAIDDRELKTDERDGLRKYIIGAPGFLIGAGLGCICAASIIFARCVTNSIVTSFQLSVIGMNFAFDASDQLEVPDDDRSYTLKWIVGAPGVFIGLAVGMLSASLLLFGRIITNSFKTAVRTVISIVNLITHPDDRGDEEGLEVNDARSWSRKYVVGAPGIFIGASFGILMASSICVARLASNSFKTVLDTIATCINLVLPEEKKTDLDELIDHNEQRPFVRKYIVGLPGLFLGAAISAIAMGVIIIARTLTNSFITAPRAFFSVINISLANRLKSFPIQLGRRDRRSICSQYVLGAPGLLIGGLLGAAVAGGIFAIRITLHSLVSFRALSGSLFNGAIEVQACQGLCNDLRPPAQKIMGTLGYVAAAVIVAPLAITLLAIRKVFSDIIPAVFGIAASIVVLPAKMIAKCINNTPRFPRDHIYDQYDQRFKNLFSSLTTVGKLPSGGSIQEEGTGEEKWKLFARKSMTCNKLTITEKTLEIIHQQYQNYPFSSEDFFTSDAYNNAIEEVEKDYRQNCFYTVDDRCAIFSEIDKVSSFIREYMNTGNNTVPIDLYQKQTPWLVTFWGRPDSKRDEQQALLSGIELLPIEISNI